MTTIITEHIPQHAQHTAEKKSNHRVNIVRVGDILPHNNADTLELIHIDGYQVVVKKGEFKTGDLAVYIQPDSVVPATEPFRFIWEPHIFGYNVADLPIVPEKRRRITVRKFRGEWSEGLLLPVSDFGLLPAYTDETKTESVISVYDLSTGKQDTFYVGDDVSDFLNITHYDPDKGKESTAAGQSIHGPSRKKRYPRSIRGWINFIKGWFKGDRRQHVDFHLPVYDVEALKNYKDAIEPGTPVVITEKIHGSNARFVFLDGTMYAGSRTLWKSPTSNCTWRKALGQNSWIEKWCRAHEGFALYGEVVPTQSGFDYGCKPGEIKFFVFDIRTPEGVWVDDTDQLTDTLEDYYVPVLGYGKFDPDYVQKLVSGPSAVARAKHIREGVVVKTIKEQHKPGLGRVQLKIVSNEFLAKDSK